MIVVVTGGRDYRCNVRDMVWIEKTLHDVGATTLRHGGCAGADRVVAMFVVHTVRKSKLDMGVEEWRARWRDIGKSAGRRRNLAMLLGDPHDADFLLEWPGTAFERARLLIALPGGRGTADCVRAAADLAIECWHAPEPVAAPEDGPF